MLEVALQQFTWEAGPAAPLQLGPGICNRLAQAAGVASAHDLDLLGVGSWSGLVQKLAWD